MAESRDFRTVIGLVLRYGVVSSFLLVALGATLLFLQGSTGYSSIGDAKDMFEMQTKFLIGFLPLFNGVASGKPYAIIDLGLIVLLATPVTRVVISIFLFAEEKRYVFVVITVAVLAILLFSMLVVAPLVSA
jgi:uncharacterized membrane protein